MMKTTKDWATELAEEMDSKDFGGLEIVPVIESYLKRYREEVLEEAALTVNHANVGEPVTCGLLAERVRTLKEKPCGNLSDTNGLTGDHVSRPLDGGKDHE